MVGKSNNHIYFLRQVDMAEYLKIRKSDGTILKQKNYDSPTRDLSKANVWLPLEVSDEKPSYDAATQKLVRYYIIPDLAGDLTDAKVTYALKAEALSDIEKLAILTTEMNEKLLAGETLTADEINERKALLGS